MTHGGRYLFVDNQEICEDDDYDMSRSPQHLESKGSVFEKDEQGYLCTADGDKVLFLNPGRGERAQKLGLLLEKINPDEKYVIRTADRRKVHQYISAGMDKLKAQGEPDSMSVFKLKEQQS
ncbi:hypothetical protein EC973_000882 [Apophysomyces ossiformis]|uniref:Uncharacterized protein n=1 Tax=Apophysomyces ossiformis TaxID=679940 RepID=A0A8H7BKB2_9FUNG|nr:hypothetical protein EC973_000882 [Apophysomyces ossiformis]